jgi:hypothetical protein
MSPLEQNWRKGQKRFCLEEREAGREREGMGGGREEKWPK